MSRGIKRNRSATVVPIWVKDPHGSKPIRFLLEEDYQIIDMLEYIIEEGHFEQWTNAKVNSFIVTHKGEELSHDFVLKDINGITFNEPLILSQESQCKKLLDYFMLTPSDKHEQSCITDIVPEVDNYQHFVDIVNSRFKKLTISPATSPIDLHLFSFQGNENSVYIHVALLLAAALTSQTDIRVIPFLSLELPFKKRGHPYQTDFIITKQTSTSTSEKATGSDAGPDVVVFKKSFPIMVLEVKTSIPLDFYKVPPSECIELLIYCSYIMRMYGRKELLGVLTDGKAWQILKLVRNDIGNGLRVEYHCILSSTEDRMVVGSIPNILRLINV